MGVKLWINKGHVFLSLCFGGRQWRESTGLKVSSDRKQNREVMHLAELIRSKREMQIAARRNGLDSVCNRQTLLEYAEENAEGRRLLTKALPYLEDYGAGEIYLTSVTPRWFEQFQKYMEGTELSLSTAERYCTAVRALLNLAVRDDILLKNPASGVKHISVPEAVKCYLTADEVKAMVSCVYRMPKTPITLQQDIRKGFLFACLTGLRVSDITQLEWGNIDVEKMTVAKRQQKTRRFVYIPLKKEALRLINDGIQHESAEKVFPELGRTKSNTNRYITRWAQESGIKKHVTWHTARHTDATLLIEAGADIYTVQKLLGHSKIATTMHYAQVSDGKKRQAVEMLPDFGI